MNTKPLFILKILSVIIHRKKFSESQKLLDVCNFLQKHVSVIASQKSSIPNDPHITYAKLASIHEFGTTHIPPRPFFYSTVKEVGRKVTSFFLDEIKKAIKRKVSIPKIFHYPSIFLVEKIQNKLGSSKLLPLSSPTIKKRRGKVARPLLDTGGLRNSIKFTVIHKGQFVA